MTLKPTWDDVIAWWKEEKVKREAATARATAAEALAGDALRALPSAERLRVLAHWLDLIDAERVLWRPSTTGAPGTEVQEDLRRWADGIDAVLNSDDARRILSRGAGLEAG